MARSLNNPWLFRFAIVTAVVALGLVCLGGLVTSHEAGMAVPDWPTTFGSNMFLFPYTQWKGGIFFEHTHRLLASGVGFLTIILAVWLWIQEPRKWMRWLGVAALAAVIIQGVLGGLRVTWMKDELGIFHAALAQLFFGLLCSIALFSSKWWREAGSSGVSNRQLYIIRNFCVTGALLLLFQLVVGATMRHQHAGLAIPDFPAAYGRLWPATDAASVAHYNQQRLEATGLHAITAFQIILQMVHRISAVVICGLAVAAVRFAFTRLPKGLLRRSVGLWGVLIGSQFLLGAATIWTGKSIDLATAHVAVGALSLVTVAITGLVAGRYLWRESVKTAAVPVTVSQGAQVRNPMEAPI
jgi:cytochrome c oxidase assembly protein subunit 15